MSTLGLGTATFGVSPAQSDADRLVACAIDAGVNYVDCANSYGNQTRFDRPGAVGASERPSAEEIVGAALKGKRNRVILASKVREEVGDGPNDRGLSRLHIVAEAEKSLRRLKTDRIDIYYMHHPDPDTPIEESLRAFDDLVRQGKVLYPAVSSFNGARLIEALWKAERYGLRAPIANQIPYNLDFRLPERDVMPACIKYDVAIMAHSPLAGGLLARPEALQRQFIGNARWKGAAFSAEQLSLATALHGIASKWNTYPNALALQWLLSRPQVATAIVGVESSLELNDNLQAIASEIPPEALSEVAGLGQQQFHRHLY